MNYTECEKLKELETDVVILTEFINHSGYILAHSPAGVPGDYLYAENNTVQEVVYDYLDIDAKQLEVERRHMLENL
jgi:hypothetical protein